MSCKSLPGMGVAHSLRNDGQGPATPFVLTVVQSGKSTCTVLKVWRSEVQDEKESLLLRSSHLTIFLNITGSFCISSPYFTMRPALALSLFLGQTYALDRTLGFNAKPTVENRTLDQIYEAAVAEGGVVTLWHGGDERNQMDFLKDAFEKRFPKMKLNLTVDLSKYHDGRIDQQLAAKNVFVDSVMLQTVHDFPRWAREGALMNYAPLGFDKIHPAFKDSVSASWYGVELLFWQNAWNTKKLPNANFSTFESFLRPEFKNKLVLTYPHDDDAVLFAFDQM